MHARVGYTPEERGLYPKMRAILRVGAPLKVTRALRLARAGATR